MAASVNLYLCTEEVTSEMDVLSSKARDAVENGTIEWVENSVDGFDKALLLILMPITNDPKWVDFLNITFPEVENVHKNRSSGAIAYIESSNDKYVIPFGSGYFSLDERKLVNDFGLMVTANSVLEDSLRFLDSNNPSAGTKSRVQVDRLSGASGFDLDSALAFIKKLGGIAQGDDFGKSLSGSTGFKFTGPAEFALLKPKLDRAKAMYGSDVYQQRGLDIIAAMKPVTTPSLIQTLDLGIVPHLLVNLDVSPDFPPA